MIEEDIFGEDSLKLVLRYGNHTILNFDKRSSLMSFEKMKNILNSKEKKCYFLKKDDKRHMIIIPIDEDGFSGRVELYADWHLSNSYEIKVDKDGKSRFISGSISLDSKYYIEQRCQIILLGLRDPFTNFSAIEDLYNLKERISKLEIAPSIIIENERQLWTKYIEAQNLIVEKLQEPFKSKGSYELIPMRNTNGEVIRYKLIVPLEESKEQGTNIYEEFANDYKQNFDDEIIIDKDGTALLSKEGIERVDVMIDRKFSNTINRFERISCLIKIQPNSILDLIKRDLKDFNNIVINHDGDSQSIMISSKDKLLQKLPDDIKGKYGLKLIGIYCLYIKTDEYKNRFYEIEREYLQSPNASRALTSMASLKNRAIDKKRKLEEEGEYSRVEYKLGQLYNYSKINLDFDEDFWNELRKDFYGMDFSFSPADNRIFFEITSLDHFEKKMDVLKKSGKFKIVNEDKISFKVRLYPVEKKSDISTFEYKKEKLKNTEFVIAANIGNKHTNVYIGNFSGKESTEKALVFSIPFFWKEDKKKAAEFLELCKKDSFKINSVKANLIGDEMKLSWLDDAVKKLDENRVETNEPNQKPVNPRLRDFIFDSSKAEPTYKFEVDNTDIEELSEYRELLNRQLLDLNSSQKIAVLKALYAKDLCLLQGPPGTGKTTVIAELIWQHIMQDSTKKLLLTSETNLAVDNALEKLMGSRNVNKELSPFLSIIKPLRFGKSSKFEEEGKVYSVERIEKWLDDEYEEDFVYENEISSLENANDDSVEDTEPDDVNHNAVQQWMIMVAQRAQTYADKNPKYAELSRSYQSSLCNPDGITKRYFKEKYFKHANVIGSTCSSTGSPSFAADYARVFSSAVFDRYVKMEGYKRTIADIKGLIKTANDNENSFQETASSIIRKIMKENNVKEEEDLQELLDTPTDNVKHFLFNYDLRFLLRPRRSRKFDTVLERLGFTNEEELNQLKSIYFDTVIMDEASKATPPDLVLPLCFGQKSIVIGDHRQLPPMLNEEDFKEALLSLEDNKATVLAEEIDRQFIETSQFARLILNPNVSKSIKSVFTEQYRMHPQINDVIKQFYKDDEGGLTCGLDPLKVDSSQLSEPESRYHGFFHPGFISPDVHVLWVKVDEPEQRTDSKALYNDKEVEAVKRVLQYLKHSAGYNDYMKYWDDNIKNEERRNQEKEIGIISFYSQQVKCLREVKAYAKKCNMRVKLNTVDKFQGMERNIVIVSTVRSNKFKTGNSIVSNTNPGFAKSPERLNVALSRARRLLIVVGNSDFFNQVKNPNNGSYLYRNVIEEMQKHHEIIDYKTLTKYARQ